MLKICLINLLDLRLSIHPTSDWILSIEFEPRLDYVIRTIEDKNYIRFDLEDVFHVIILSLCPWIAFETESHGPAVNFGKPLFHDLIDDVVTYHVGMLQNLSESIRFDWVLFIVRVLFDQI